MTTTGLPTTTTTTNPPASPSSSPRLPSPPPLTEDQLGPKSPGIGDGLLKAPPQLSGEHHMQETHDAGPTRRIRPGTRADAMATGPPLVPLGELDSAFQLQEHLKSLYYHHTQPAHLDHMIPISKATALNLSTPPEGVDRSLWLYELCRLLTDKLNMIIVAFFNDEPPCSATTCAEMRASEWQYLCAVHDPPKPCCAIDYCCHTLDWAANMLTSTKHFPSRLTLGAAASTTSSGGGEAGGSSGGGGGGGGGGMEQGLRNLTNICRRLYRIFAHAWYQHRAVFWQVESQTGLYVFFKTVCDVYQLIPEDNYTVPPEAEGLDGDESMTKAGGTASAPPAPTTMIFKDHQYQPHHHHHHHHAPSTPAAARDHDVSSSSDISTMNPGLITTRRHMSSLSVGSTTSSSTGVSTVLEVEEDEELQQQGKSEGEKEEKEMVKGEGEAEEAEEKGGEQAQEREKAQEQEQEQEQTQEQDQQEREQGQQEQEPQQEKSSSSNNNNKEEKTVTLEKKEEEEQEKKQGEEEVVDKETQLELSE